MTTAVHTGHASPVSLLSDWQNDGKGPLREFLVLGHTIDLPFLEAVAVPRARALGARVAILGDAGHAPHEAVDVRPTGRGHLHGVASCHGAFHPRLALLLGDGACRVAIGSGDPTPSGWGADGEPWTVVATDDGASHPLLADLADWLEALPDAVAMAPWWADHLRHLAELLTVLHCEAPPTDTEGPEVELAHNLWTPLMDRLPEHPVDELRLYAPFADPSGELLRLLRERMSPGEITLEVQRGRSHHDSAGVRRAFEDHPAARVRELAENRTRHGRLVEWRVGDTWHALTGSPDLTRAALARAVGDATGGTAEDPARNCELAVIAHDTAPPLPDEDPLRPAAFLHDAEGRAPRGAADTVTRLSGDHAVDELFRDAAAARRFEQDVARLRALAVTDAAGPGGAAHATVADCRRALGTALTELAFGPLASDLPRLPQAPAARRGQLSEHLAADEEDETPGAEPEEVPSALPDSAREQARAWIAGLARRPDAEATRADQPAGDDTAARARPWSVPTTLLVTALHLRLLAAGGWDEDDYAWRAVTADLLHALDAADDDVPREQRQRLDAVTAVCVSLLGLHGDLEGPDADPLAAAAWRLARTAVARAEPEHAADLCLPPGRRGAPVATEVDVEALAKRARDVPDPVAEAHRALEAAHVGANYENGVWELAGEFSNPQAACAKAVTLLAALRPGPVLARAHARGTGVPCFMAWSRPLLIRQRGRQWTAFRITAPATPLATFQSAAPRPTAQGDEARRGLGPLLDEAGLDPVSVFLHLQRSPGAR
ncbi:hypothetical protein [Streptomyces hydrogenans]|uniref:hypothetical protein n=1 Tax=Streptomyces hydrogenans TaxID=1873719 RepID=UPI003800D8DD